VQIDPKTNNILRSFDSAADAAEAVGLSANSINDGVRRCVSRGGYIWERESDELLQSTNEREEAQVAGEAREKAESPKKQQEEQEEQEAVEAHEEEILLEERREEQKKRAREQEKRLAEQEEEDDREEQDASLKSNLHSNVTKAMVTLESEEFLPGVSARITRSNHAKYQ
jgi:flagellar biosynthesis GTPase FlhF